ncbi:MAG: 30S ribosomal protein S12 methylthiotransferase RimO [Anaerohalosphaeraceae bacterium]|nr:30S ribosomal protein S12 methylthiotransferase RimO [Anaerohalosphaeraceae bacterium]
MGAKRKKTSGRLRGSATTKNNQPKTVGFVSLGCAKNTVDSERMLAKIVEAGYLLNYDIEDADVIVINTCGFIAPAKAEAIEIIKEASEYKAEGRVKKIVAAGCLSERMKEQLLEEVPEIDAVVGLGQRDNVAEIITALLASDENRLYLSDGDWGKTVQDDSDRLLINPPHWAYLRISEGCDRRCAFCTIPMIKGRFRSKPLEQTVSEAKQLVSAGAIELSIIAQDSNYYGKDLPMENGLVKLLDELEKIDKLKWIRLMYLYPAGVDDLLIEKIAGSEKIVNYIDMPIQHINDTILKNMGRSDTRRKTTELIEKLRKAMGDVVLRTTLIVGFPGETDKQFAELVDFVKWARFEALGCFAYWPEDGTKAAEMSGQIAQEIKEKRSEEIMLTQQKIAFDINNARIGSKLRCLAEEKVRPEQVLGRFYGQAPHIDSICLIENCKAAPGEFVDCEVSGTQGYDLVCKKI